MKKTLRIVIVMLLAVIFAVPVSCKKDPAPAGEQNAALPDTDIVLAENGQTGYTVLLPAEATLAEQYAADLLVERFREATGATLPVEYDAGEPLDESRKTLSIGFTSVMRDSGITVTEAELNADGFKIVRRGNTVIMAGAHDGGHIYAVQEFLHRQFAYEVYATDEVYIETTDKAFVKDYNLTEIPDFATRDMDGLLSYAPELAVSLRMRQINLNNAQYGYGGSRDWMPHFGHTYYDLIPKDKYNVKPADGDENPDYHPEWYSSLQLCLTNEEMIATFIENFKPIILNNPYGRIVNIGENDGSGFCTCEKCTEEIRRYGRSGYTIRFANKVIAGLEAWKAEEPAVKDRDWVYAIFAYTASQTIAPPLDDNGNLVDPSCRPDDKLYIRITPLDPVCYAHPWSDPGECSTARTMYEHMQGWQTVTDNFMIWDYDANYSCYYMFHNTFNSTQKNLQLYRDMGVVNLFRENATGSTMRSLVDLNTYINCKLMWNVDADLQQLMDDFIDNFYKTGAPYIRQYIDMMRSYYDILDVTTDGGYHITNYQDVTVFGSKWPARIFEQALDLFDQAIATYAPLAESDPELYETMVNRVLKESVCVRFVILGNYATYYDINAAAYDEMIDQFEADAERVGATNYSEGGSLSDWIAGLRAA